MKGLKGETPLSVTAWARAHLAEVETGGGEVAGWQEAGWQEVAACGEAVYTAVEAGTV